LGIQRAHETILGGRWADSKVQPTISGLRRGIVKAKGGGNYRLEAGGWRLETGDWRLEAGGLRLEA
jgi:hypothetical protein